MSPSQGKIIVPVAIIASALAIAVLLFLNRPVPEQAVLEKQILLINAAKVVKQDVKISVRSQGTVMPRTATSLIAEVSGRIIKVSDQFKVGGFFHKGDSLLLIDQRDYLTDLKRAEAAVASAKSNLASEEGRAEVAYQDWKKYRSSVKRSDAANDLALRKPQLADAKAKLDSAMADLEHAQDQLDRTTIRAPYDGIVRSKEVDLGQYVNVGNHIADTFAIDYAELRLALPESKLNYLQLPTMAGGDDSDKPSVELVANIGGEPQRWQAQLVRTEGVFDERSRVLFAVAQITDPYGITTQRDHPLRIGTFVDASIEGRTIDNLVALPRYLLRAGSQIWIIDQQQRLQNRRVTVLRTEGKIIYVTSGLDEGELVCLSNISGAIPGTPVRISSTTTTDYDPDAEQSPPHNESTPDHESTFDIAPAQTIPSDQYTPAAELLTPSEVAPNTETIHTGSHLSPPVNKDKAA